MWALTAAQRMLMLGSPDEGKRKDGSIKPVKRLSMDKMRQMTQKRLGAVDDLTHDGEAGSQ